MFTYPALEMLNWCFPVQKHLPLLPFWRPIAPSLDTGQSIESTDANIEVLTASAQQLRETAMTLAHHT